MDKKSEMSSLKELLSENILDAQNLLNVTLVEYGGRPGTLLQHADYNEAHASGPIMKKKLNAIKKLYPNLHHTWIGEGMLITKIPVSTDISYWNTYNIGKILGFIEPFENLNIPHKYGIHISVKLKQLPKEINIVSMIATKPHKKELKELTTLYKNTLLKSPLFKEEIQEVTSQIDEIISEETLINKLLNKEHMSKKLKDEIANYIWNIGLENLPLYDFEYKNSLHIGILIALLLQHKYDPCTPFYPVNETDYYEQFNKYNGQYEEVLIHFLDNNLEKEQSILYKLRNAPETLNEKETRDISKAISYWGKNNSITLSSLLKFPFIYTNQIHVGIVATIYILKLNDPMQAFESIQTSNKLKEMAVYYNLYADEITRIAKEAQQIQIPSRSSSNSHSSSKSSSQSSSCSGKNCKLTNVHQQGCNIQ